ncbi:MAG TPA: BON domain-containing protein [Terriglobales bacterium]|nr:BON domain-containing protein [Terriglobales bacterium]
MKTVMLAVMLCSIAAFAQAPAAQNSTASAPNTSQQTTPAAGSMQQGTTDQSNSNVSQRGLERISKEVRHELVTLPFYGVFDNLAYKVDPDGTVTLLGQVARPTLKSDAERAVKNIEGVTRVVNNIEVLPTSPNDDRIRREVYRAIYGNEVLSQYQLRAVPPIHIIVKNGNVTLEGVVSRQMDKQVAEIQAKSVPGVFSVTNNLRVEND